VDAALGDRHGGFLDGFGERRVGVAGSGEVLGRVAELQITAASAIISLACAAMMSERKDAKSYDQNYGVPPPASQNHATF
jgi:hypothetical protein